MNELARLFLETKGKLGPFLAFYNEIHMYNINLNNIQEGRALANQLPQIKDEYHQVSTLLGITKKQTQDQQHILSSIGNSISSANSQLSDLQFKIQNANMEINRNNEEILNLEQIQNSMKNSDSYKDLVLESASENVQKYMDQRRTFFLVALTVTRNTLVKNPEFRSVLDPAADPYGLPLNNRYLRFAEAEFQELLMDMHTKEIMKVGYMMREKKNLPSSGKN